MKIHKIIYIVIAILGFNSNVVYSQEATDNINLLVIREDVVVPSLSHNYELFLADIKSYLEEKNVKNFKFATNLQDNYTFRYVTPIKSLNDIKDTDYISLSKKLQDPELDLMLQSMNESIVSYKQFIVKYKPELSYVPEGENWDASTYRKWGYYYFYPGSEADVEKILASWKDLYQAKGAKMGFKVFTSFLGEEKPLYVFTTCGKNPLDYHNNLNELGNLLGEDGAMLWLKMMQYVRDTKTVEGWYLPQYSYDSGK
jgi:hypothetical protein